MRRTMRSAILLISLVTVGAMAAEPAPEDAAKYRQSIMKALSGHNGTISLISRGKAGNPDNLASHVEALVALAGEVAPVFAAGSDTDDDEALPAIWENPDAFAEAVAKFEDAVAAFESVADSSDLEATDAAQRELGKACKGCHEDFRQKDD